LSAQKSGFWIFFAEKSKKFDNPVENKSQQQRKSLRVKSTFQLQNALQQD